VVREHRIDRITARLASSWAMRAAREPHYLTGVFICLSPGLGRITEPCGRTAGFLT